MLIGLMFIVAALLALLAANKSLRMRGLSGGRTSMRFILVTLAVFAPMAILLVELNTTAAQNDAVIGPSGGKILMVGGRSSSSILGSTELYDPATNTFAPVDQTASMNAPRFEATATLLTSGPNAGKVLVAGGLATQNPFALASTELYDPRTNSFAPSNQTASMNSGRFDPTATTLVTGPNAGKF